MLLAVGPHDAHRKLESDERDAVGERRTDKRGLKATGESAPSLRTPGLPEAVGHALELALGGIERVSLELGLDHIDRVDGRPEGVAGEGTVRQRPEGRNVLARAAMLPDVVLNLGLIGEEVKSSVSGCGWSGVRDAAGTRLWPSQATNMRKAFRSNELGPPTPRCARSTHP